MTTPRAGVPLRAIGAADLAAVHRLQRRVEAHDRIPIVTPEQEFEEWLDDPHLDLGRDTRLVEAEGEVVAWGRVWYRPGGRSEERALLFGAVDPRQRGRGIGSALLAWQIERAAERVRAATSALPRFVRAHAYDFQRESQRLFARHGMTPVRYHDELLRGLESPAPATEVEGIELVRWDAARGEETRLALNDAFTDHWGSTPRDRAAWEHENAAFGVRLDLSFLALAGGRVVGGCRNGHFPGDEAVTGRRDGWIMTVGVVRSCRRRGIASALVAASIDAFRGAGLTHAALGVDSANPTGAYRLYERLGFRPMHRTVVVQREV